VVSQTARARFCGGARYRYAVGNAGRRYWITMLVSLILILVGVAGVGAFPPTKSDGTWVRFVCFVIIALGGCLTLFVSAVACFLTAIVAWRRKGRN